MHTQLSRIANHRAEGRHVIGTFVAPGTQAGAMEGFMVVDLSSEGMSLLRVAPKPSEDARRRKRGLDYRFSWLAIPLPERGTHVCALTEVIHRRRFGPLELLGVRFEQMADEERAALEDYVRERDRLSFGAPQLRQEVSYPPQRSRQRERSATTSTSTTRTS